MLWRDGLARAIGIFVCLRLLYTLAALALYAFAPVYAPCTDSAPATQLQSTGSAFWLLGMWQRADGCMYEWIAAVHYSPHDLYRFAFFPLYPLLLRLFSYLPGTSYTLSGLLISGLAYIAGITGLYCLVSRDFDTRIAKRAILYLSAFPSAFFLFAPFTEALFLALSIWALYSARRAWWCWAAFLGLFAALTRTQGLLLALPLGWEALRYCYKRWQRREWQYWPLAIVMGPLGGFFLYSAYVWHTVGLTTWQIQQVWGARMAPPWIVLLDSWRYIVARTSIIEAINFFLIASCTLLACAGARRLPLSYTLVCAPQLLLLLTREAGHSPLTSASRYLLVLFPLFVVLALHGQRPWLHYSWFTVSLLLLLVLLFFFLGGPFVA